VFFVNVPLSLVLIGATLKVIAESRDPSAKGLDYPGTITFSSGLALLIWALIDANDAGWASRRILIRFAAAAILLLGFVIAELRRGRPMIDLSLFKRRTFLGAVLAMIGYGASAQVMVFFLPLFLQNAYGYRPLTAGIAMLPFALPMVLAPRFTNIAAGRYSGRTLLATGLAITAVGDVLFWLVAGAHIPYEIFVVSMLVAGAGAGLLNGQTVKVIGGAVPQERSGMASGIASTTRFIGILVSVAGMGAVMANVVHRTFESAAVRAGLSTPSAVAAAKRVLSGDLNELVTTFPASEAQALHAAGLSSFSRGFGAASLLGAAVALVACLLTLLLIRARETAPALAGGPRPCKSIDCRDPL
jgi:Na+/melibiose symporter-like transporter